MDSIIKACYVVGNLIAKESKECTVGELIKQCMENMADIICFD